MDPVRLAAHSYKNAAWIPKYMASLAHFMQLSDSGFSLRSNHPRIHLEPEQDLTKTQTLRLVVLVQVWLQTHHIIALTDALRSFKSTFFFQCFFLTSAHFLADSVKSAQSKNSVLCSISGSISRRRGGGKKQMVWTTNTKPVRTGRCLLLPFIHMTCQFRNLPVL